MMAIEAAGLLTGRKAAPRSSDHNDLGQTGGPGHFFYDFFMDERESLVGVLIQIDGEGLLDLNGAEFNKNFFLGIHDYPPSERLGMLVNKRFSWCIENNWQSRNKKLSKLLAYCKKYTGGRTI
jgi:hypothetical protein